VAERLVVTALPLVLLSTDCGNATAPASIAVESRGRVSARAESVGIATYYARRFHGRITASGIEFDQNDMVAAHPTFPFGTVVRVTNLRNGRSVNVRIVDRGPAAGARRRGVIIDLSRAAAESLDFIEAGRSRVRVEQLSSE
jgi:rare lipoprotein A